VYLHQRQYDAAIDQEKKTLELDRTFALAHDMLGIAYLQLGRHQEALAEALQTRKPALRAAAYYALGDVVAAKEVVHEQIRLAATHYQPPYTIASSYLGIDDREQAFPWLEAAFLDRSLRPDFMKVDPWFDRVRADARFESLLRRAGLQP
jgi:tetratricopeptide (TPR) repeat protein